MELHTKANTFLVAPQIPRRVPLLLDIMPKISKLNLEDFDSRLQEGLERTNCMVMIQARMNELEVLKPMKWDTGVD